MASFSWVLLAVYVSGHAGATGSLQMDLLLLESTLAAALVCSTSNYAQCLYAHGDRSAGCKICHKPT